jgi:multidrug efflux system membrane fusion protein
MHRFLVAMGLLVLGAGLGAGALWLATRGSSTAATPDTPTEPPRLLHTPEGETVVRLDTPTQERVGLKVDPLVAATRQPALPAYGLLQEDPAESFTLRAPVAGILRAADSATWPDLNRRLDAGTVVGYIEPRLTQTERIDLAARLTQARADAAEAEAALAAARASYESKRELNAENKSVSDRVVEEAKAKLKSEEARRDAALEIVHLIESAGAAASAPTSRFELPIEQAGEVLDVPARPGEAVEAGQTLLRLARFGTLIARIELPLGQPFDEAAPTAVILPVGDEQHALVGQRIGLAAASEYSAARGPILLFRVATAGLALRPGAAVVAHVPTHGNQRTGVLIPRAAVIRLLGKAWTYVQTAGEQFARRELVNAEFTGDAWFVTRGFEAGQQVVTDGAQVLLSEELKAQIAKEEAAAE